MPPGAYQAEPPEATSAQFWFGPGAGSFFASAANLKALAAAIIGMLGGHMSTEAAMAASWPSLSGEIARLAHTPHLAWLGTAGAMVAEAGMAIDATAASFETSKFATPHPGEVAANQSEHVALNNANFLGFLTPLIIANRVDYGRMWMQGVTNKYAYEAGSVPLQTVPPLPPPPPSTTGGAGSGTPGLDQASGEAGAPLDSFFQQMTGMLPAIGQMPMSAVQSLGSGGPLKTLTEVPSQLLSQMGSLASAANLSPEAGLDGFAASDWVTSTPLAGGAVNASLAGGGGGGGLGGAGTISAASALRSPGSWASAVSAAAPATGESTSRFNEVRAQSSTVPASAGGGMGGAMAPLAHGAAAGAQNNNDEKKTQTEPGQVLVSAADLFRSSDAMPVITGGGGLTRASAPGDKEAPV